MEEKVKFIRGVKGRGDEIIKLFREMYPEIGIPDFCYGDPNTLYFTDETNRISAHSDNSVIGKLVLAYGEEMFLPPKFKFKVGDKVIARHGLEKFVLEISKSYINIFGELYYVAHFNDGLEIKIPEVDLEPFGEPQIKTWDDLIGKQIKGFYLDIDGNLDTFDKECNYNDRNLAASEKVAKSMQAMAQISQLMPFYGGVITDEEWARDKVKFVIVCVYNQNKPLAYGDYTRFRYNFLAFHTAEQRNKFLKNNERLVRDYLMLD